MSNSGFHVYMPTQENDNRPFYSLTGPALLDGVTPGPVGLYHGKVLPHPSGISTISSWVVSMGPCVLSLAANRGVVVLSVWLGECPRVASSSATVNVVLLSDWPSSLWGHFPHSLAPKLLDLLSVWKVGCREPLRLSV